MEDHDESDTKTTDYRYQLGGFPAAYAETQAEYMASGKATEQEKLVAGCPEYAFNEYLQIGLEQG